MLLGNFSASIVGKSDNNGYVPMKHGEQYRINLQNYDNQKRCAAEVKVDGKVVGLFRIRAGGSLTLERPSNENGRFTFYKDGTPEASKAGLDSVTRSDKGLVSVTFKPEKHVQPVELQEDRRQPWYPSPHPLPGMPRPGPVPMPRPYYEGSDRGYTLSSPVGSADVDRAVPTSASNESRTKGVMGQSASYSSGGTGLSGSSSQTFKTVGHLDYDESAFVTITLRLVAENDDPRPLRPLVASSTPVPEPV